MTAAEAIAQADELEPNQYGATIKLAWLNELDGQIFREVVDTHEDPIRAEFEAYTKTTEELLVPFPWAGEIYRWYLISQVRLHNAETARYNQAIAAFAAAYQSFTDDYTREHAPKSGGDRFLF